MTVLKIEESKDPLIRSDQQIAAHTALPIEYV